MKRENLKKNILAIDYGKNAGVLPFATSCGWCLRFRPQHKLLSMNDLCIYQRLIAERRVTQLVVGLPLTLDGGKAS